MEIVYNLLSEPGMFTPPVREEFAPYEGANSFLQEDHPKSME